MGSQRSEIIGNKLSKSALKSVLTIAMVAALAVCGVVAIIATHSPSLRNTFTPGTAEVEIIEPGVDPDSVEWGKNTKPVALTIPQSGNTVAGVVRAMISPYSTAPGGNGEKNIFPGMARPIQDKIVMGDITLHFDPAWSDNWFYKDGYFYYNKVLNPGETTPLLLAGITLTDPGADMAAKYEALQVDVEVIADVLQAGGGAPAEWGLAVDSGNNVSVSAG